MKIIMFKKNKKGYISAMDVLLSVAVGAIVSIGLLKYQSMAAQWSSFSSSAHTIQNVGAAANGYVSKRFIDFVNLTNSTGQPSDPGPRICDAATATCAFSETTLVNEGFLPQGWKSDPRSNGYTGFVKVVQNIPNAIIKGFIISNNPYGGSPILTPGIPHTDSTNNTDLYQVVQNAGVDAGYTVLSGGATVENSPWGWSMSIPIASSIAGNVAGTNPDYSNHLIYRIGFGASDYATQTGYMLLDGSTPMQAALNMGGNSIYGASTIHSNALNTSSISASTVLSINREEDGTVYNATSNSGKGGKMPNRLLLAGALNVGSTSIVGSTNGTPSTITSKGPIAVTSTNGTGSGNATLDAAVINLSQVNTNTGTLQEGTGSASRTFGIEANQLNNYLDTTITTPNNISLLATSMHAAKMTATLEDDSTNKTTIANLQGKASIILRNVNVTAPTMYATNQSGNSINAVSYAANTPGGSVSFAPTACVTGGGNAKCGSNINATTGYATLTGGLFLYNPQLAYTTCTSSGGLVPAGTLALDINHPNNLLSCTIINQGTGEQVWVPVSRNTRTYTYIGTSSESCPTDLTILTGGASCSGGQISNPGAISGNSYTGATCSAGPAANVVIICRY